MDEIIQAVSTVGFPIAMCIWCYYTQQTTMKDLRETIQHNTEVIEHLFKERDK